MLTGDLHPLNAFPHIPSFSPAWYNTVGNPGGHLKASRALFCILGHFSYPGSRNGGSTVVSCCRLKRRVIKNL